MEGKMFEWTGEPDEEKITELISLPFEEKEKIAMNIAKDSIVNAKNPFVCFSGGKKSLVLLNLIKNLSLCGAPPHDPASPVRAYKKALPKKYYTLYPIKRGYDGALNVLHIDTTVEFDNIYLYIEKMRKLWRFNLIREKQSDIEDIRTAENKEECCKKLKMEPLKNAIEK